MRAIVVHFERFHARRRYIVKRRDFVKTMTAVGTGLLLPGARFAWGAQEQTAPDPAVKRVLVMF